MLQYICLSSNLTISRVFCYRLEWSFWRKTEQNFKIHTQHTYVKTMHNVKEKNHFNTFELKIDIIALNLMTTAKRASSIVKHILLYKCVSILSERRNSHSYLPPKKQPAKNSSVFFYHCFVCAGKFQFMCYFFFFSLTLSRALFPFYLFNVKLKLDKATKQCSPEWCRVYDAVYIPFESSANKQPYYLKQQQINRGAEKNHWR